jgi:peptidoglycan/LPS O-acetylase OafA/YrhL
MIYRHEIDGLRAVAVLSVIFSHAGFDWIPGGFAGVDAFFVISGFLITGIILRDLEEGCFTFRNFYARRARRILPALFCMLTSVSILAWLMLSPSQVQDISISVFASVLSLSNFYFIDFIDYFAPSSDYIMLLHTWSLGVEEQFYFLFPLFAFAAYRILGKSGFWAVVAVLLVASFVISEWGWRNEPRGNYFFSPSRFWEILIGSIAALWCSSRDIKGNDPLAALGLMALFLTFFLYDDSIMFPSYYALLPTIGTVLVLTFARGSTMTANLLRFDLIRFIGLISFSAYLWHQPVFVFARVYGYETAKPLTGVVLTVIILLTSTLSWRFVEQTFRRTRTATPTRRGAVLWAAAVGLVALSLAGYFTKLPSLRFNKVDQKLLSVTRLEARDYQRHIDDRYSRLVFKTDDPRPKVAFIGDSFGRDFMNVLNELQILEDLQASKWLISQECAPFFLRETEQDLRNIWDTIDCGDYDRYKSPEMLAAVAAADVVVLASSWRFWHQPHIVNTIKNIGAISNARILLVGPKNFGEVSTVRLLRIPPLQRSAFRSDLDEDLIITNDLLRQIEGVTFLDIIRALCDPKGGCPQITQAGHLISQDGTHLTRSGAVAVGEALNQDYRLRNLFGLLNR